MAAIHSKIKAKTLLSLYWTLLIWGFTGCGIEWPSLPPNLFYKFNVLKVGRGPAHLITVDLNMDGSADLVSANAKNNTLSILLGKRDGHFGKARTFRSGH